VSRIEGLPVIRCDGVTPRESVESRLIVTVLVTRLPHRGAQELDGHSFALADRAMDLTPLVVAGAPGWATRVRIPDRICPSGATFVVEGRAA
jgi:hypothetical protein